MSPSAANYYSNPLQGMNRGVKVLLILNMAVYALMIVPAVKNFSNSWLALDLRTFLPWQAVSYMFMHDSLMHILFNMLGLIFFGTSIEQAMGTRTFVGYYLLCGVGGALFGYLLSLLSLAGLQFNLGLTVGASGALFGLLYACYRYFPDATVLIFFILPVKIIYVLIFISLFSFLSLFERSGSYVAHYAHFGGLLSGFLIFRYGDKVQMWKRDMKERREKRAEVQSAALDLSVDEILDKINSAGIHSLSRREREILKRASRQYGDRTRQG